jgi:tetratricopeptide (TPR) repeat protein
LLAYANGDLVSAEQQFRQALKDFAANAGAQAALGDLTLQQTDPAAALQSYDLALSLLPEYAYSFSVDNALLLEPVLWVRRGLALTCLDQPEQAEQALLETTPQWAQARFVAGSV